MEPAAPGRGAHPAEADAARRAVVDSIAAGLKRYGAPMTLFFVGQYMTDANGAELTRRWRDHGVAFGSHTMGHKDLGTLPDAAVRQQVRLADEGELCHVPAPDGLVAVLAPPR